MLRVSQSDPVLRHRTAWFYRLWSSWPNAANEWTAHVRGQTSTATQHRAQSYQVEAGTKEKASTIRFNLLQYALFAQFDWHAMKVSLGSISGNPAPGLRYVDRQVLDMTLAMMQGMPPLRRFRTVSSRDAAGRDHLRAAALVKRQTGLLHLTTPYKLDSVLSRLRDQDKRCGPIPRSVMPPRYLGFP